MADRWSRQTLRAPLSVRALYGDEGYVFRAQIKNISQGGLLLNSLPNIPRIKVVPLIFELPMLVELSQMDTSDIKKINREELDYKIIRTKIKIVRSFEGKSDVESIFVNNVGGQFISLNKTDESYITDYCSLMSRNVVYLLSLFESGGKGEERSLLLRHCTSLLGYDSSEKLPLLRLKILHDYQSLENP
jgi:hypothetical protein